MADQGLNGGGPVEVGPGPGEDPPRKRLRHEDHETQMAAQHIAHGMPHYAAPYGAAPYEGALEHLLREGDHSEAHAQAVAQVQAQLQAAHQDQLQQQQQQQQPQEGQPNVSEGVPVGQNLATPGVDPPGFTYRNRARRKASEKPVGSSQIRQSFSKRKRGIAQKAYQLFKITDAKVFLFCANDKGASWAYSTPGFGAALAPAHLKLMRQMANPDIDDAAKDNETTNTMIMAHPPGAENDPDDRESYVQDNAYAEDADGNMIGGVEGEQAPEGWATHEGTMQACGRSWPSHCSQNIQLGDVEVEGRMKAQGEGALRVTIFVFTAMALQSAAAAAAEMSSQHQAHGGYEHVPPVSIGQEMHHHNGENLHFIADAAANAGYNLGEHGEHGAQQVVHGQDASQHQHPHMDPQTGDYAGATVLGAPVDPPPAGEPAFGVPSQLQTHGDGNGHR